MNQSGKTEGIGADAVLDRELLAAAIAWRITSAYDREQLYNLGGNLQAPCSDVAGCRQLDGTHAAAPAAM
jgi:hypothetical protein